MLLLMRSSFASTAPFDVVPAADPSADQKTIVTQRRAQQLRYDDALKRVAISPAGLRGSTNR